MRQEGAATHEAMITQFEADVLLHASSNGRYVTGEAAVLAIADAGLLFDHGPQRLAAGDHYLVTTAKGREALNEWKAAQPKPPKPKRRCSEQFQAWRDYLGATYDHMSFPDFLKHVWPYRHEYGNYRGGQ